MATIDELCSWKKADTQKTLAAHGLGALFASLGVGRLAEDLFGEVPATYVHRGDVRHRKPVLCDARGHGIYVVDGSLCVDGPFTFFTADAYTILVVTGDLVASDLVQAWDTQLVVLGATKLNGLLFVDLSDAGFAVFRGPFTSRERRISVGVESDVPMFAKTPKGKLVERWSGPSEPADIHLALERGDAMTKAPRVAKGTKKPPADAALKKMSIAEALTVTGFTKMVFEGERVNPNWFVKGTPGCAVQSVTIAAAYVDAFPPELASLTELVLLSLSDAKLLALMLRSLSVLRSLKRLRIANSAIIELPVELRTLPNLEVLELSGNKQLKRTGLDLLGDVRVSID